MNREDIERRKSLAWGAFLEARAFLVRCLDDQGKTAAEIVVTCNFDGEAHAHLVRCSVRTGGVREAQPPVGIAVLPGHAPRKGTVAFLRAALVDVDPDLEVILRVADDEGLTYLGTLTSANVDAGCTDTPAMLLDGAVDEIEGEEDGS